MEKMLTNSVKFCFAFLLLFGVSLTITYGQTNLLFDFHTKIQEVGLDIAMPVEGSFRERKARRQIYFSPDYILHSKKQKVEIQYLVINASPHQTIVPQVHIITTLSNLAQNEEDHSTIAIHDIETQTLHNDFNADWGAIAFFQPKQSISKYKHAKLLSLFKAEKGMAYVLILFNEGNEHQVGALSKGIRFN